MKPPSSNPPLSSLLSTSTVAPDSSSNCPQTVALSSPASILLSSYSNPYFHVPLSSGSGSIKPSTVTNSTVTNNQPIPDLNGLLGAPPGPLLPQAFLFPQPRIFPSPQPVTHSTISPMASHPVPTVPAQDWISKVKKPIDRSLSRLFPVTLSPAGVPRVIIPQEVYQKGAELHRDFVVCRFFGRTPAYSLIQNVLNFMWGKCKHLEIHMSPAKNSVLVRIPNDFIRQKVIQKGFWYVDTMMFHVSQWAAHADDFSPSLQRVQLWAHLIGVPFDLIHQQGLSHIAGQIGEPKKN